jgi:phosphatidylserine/phosphatidylglycerophosphate/cardiolipin synthase-like enzyme
MIGAPDRVRRDAAMPSSTGAIVRPGRNCWRVERADRFLCVQDAADYYRLVRRTLLAARDTVFILGWDILASVDLDPGARHDAAPTRLDTLLAFIARRRPRLRCYLLIWDYGAIYTLERDPFSRWRLGWWMPQHVRFAFDDRHAIGGCHHQKVVVVDDQLAFCGGVDLTGHRWDTSAHRVIEPARKTAVGETYEPYHEVQAMVSGPVARSLGVLARDRWHAIGEERMPALGSRTDDLWPSDIRADLEAVDVAIARTMPGSDTAPAVRECEALFLDSIAQAERAIYIESQYFTNEAIGAALAARLREPDGPELIVVAPRQCEGWLERNTMGAFRDGVFRQLISADEHRRLRLVYPAASRAQNVPTFVHSKVMIVDDMLVRIGSANISRRSMGVDSECDLAVDAGGDMRVRAGIRHIRDRLLAEHLGSSVEEVARAIDRAGSLRAVVDARASADHTLVPIDFPASETPLPEAVRAAADPDEPLLPGASDLVARVHATVWMTLLPVLLAFAGVGALVRDVLLHPSVTNRLISTGAAVLVIVIATILRATLLIRQSAPSITRHRKLAEFG